METAQVAGQTSLVIPTEGAPQEEDTEPELYESERKTAEQRSLTERPESPQA